MSDIALRVENSILRPLLSVSKARVEGYILSGVEGLSKLYPSTRLRAGHLGRAQQRHDTPSTSDHRSALRTGSTNFTK
jgi:hypothetical protein